MKPDGVNKRIISERSSDSDRDVLPRVNANNPSPKLTRSLHAKIVSPPSSHSSSDESELPATLLEIDRRHGFQSTTAAAGIAAIGEGTTIRIDEAGFTVEELSDDSLDSDEEILLDVVRPYAIEYCGESECSRSESCAIHNFDCSSDDSDSDDSFFAQVLLNRQERHRRRRRMQSGSIHKRTLSERSSETDREDILPGVDANGPGPKVSRIKREKKNIGAAEEYGMTAGASRDNSAYFPEAYGNISPVGDDDAQDAASSKEASKNTHSMPAFNALDRDTMTVESSLPPPSLFSYRTDRGTTPSTMAYLTLSTGYEHILGTSLAREGLPRGDAGSASSFASKENFLEDQVTRLRRELERAWEIHTRQRQAPTRVYHQQPRSRISSFIEGCYI